jgi:hypothetical protein
MATTRLAQIYNPLTFGRRAQLAQIALNRFLACGIIAADPEMQAQIASGGNIGELTQFNALPTAEPNYSSDDPDVKSTPKNISGLKMRFRGANMNESWSTMDLARELALQDPMGAITNRVGAYWATNSEQRLIYSCRGIMADNIANDAGDMVVDISNDDAGAVDLDAEAIGGAHVIDVLQTLGDRSFSIGTMAMHSVPFSKLQKDKLIEYVQIDGVDIRIPTYLGKRVVVDDSLPAIAGVNRTKYTTILFGGAVFGSASGKVLVPSEMKRDPDAGNGGGQDTIFSRDHSFLHPHGWDFTSASVAGQSATRAELATAANWDRKVDRKLVPIAFLVTNG